MLFAILPPERDPLSSRESKQAGDETKTPPKGTEKKGSLFSQLTSLFDERSHGRPLRERGVSVHKRVESVLANAQAIIQNLTSLKERLMIEFGDSSHSFIAKSIDPMIGHATKLVEDIHESDDEGSLTTILDRAVESVGLYAQFSDEQKLKKKIVKEAVLATKQAIEKDCQILQNYELHFLQDEVMMTPERDATENLLAIKLEPIFQEFYNLAKEEFTTDDLRELFLWKSDIDAKRGALTELGLLTIDSVLHHPTAFQKQLDQEEVISAANQIAAIEKIEDSAQNLLQLLETNSNFDPESFREMGDLIADLKSDVQSVEPSLTNEFQDIFDAVQATITQLEELLREKRNEK